jgi:transcriptional regulator with XRE-family HTH domain
VLGLDKRSIARYEQGGALPSIEAAARLAKPLGASLDALAGMPAAAGFDPELARLLARFADLNDFDRAAIKRVIAMALAGK